MGSHECDANAREQTLGPGRWWVLPNSKQENGHDSGLFLLFYLLFNLIQFPGWFMTIYGLYQKFMSAKMQNRVLLVGHDLGPNFKIIKGFLTLIY